MMNLAGHYQNAYVTHDLDSAMALIGERYGERDWIRYDPEMTIRTPDGKRQSSVRVALAWYGGLQIELIEPVAGHNAHYECLLPADRSDAVPRFHHMAMRRDDEAAMRAETELLGLPLAFEGDVPDAMVFIYLDARQTMGHFLEYVWANEAGWQMNGWPQDRPVI